MFSPTIMQVAVSSVNSGLKVKPSRVKKAMDALRSATGRLTKICLTMMCAPQCSACRRAFERGDVEFLHAHHRHHCAVDTAGVRIGDEVDQPIRHDLPRQAVAVGEPAALLRFRRAVCAEFFPVMIDLGLRLAMYDERHRRAELEMRSAVERGETLAVEFEFDRHRRPGGLTVLFPARFAVARDLDDARVGED